MVPCYLSKVIVTINFKTMKKSITEVVEYLEILEASDIADKKSEHQKSGK